MLDPEDPLGERLGRVIREDRHGPLRDDRARVVALVDEVDRRPAHPHAGSQHSFVHPPPVQPGAAERRERPRMDVHHPGPVGAHHLGRHEPQVAGEDHVLDRVLSQNLEERPSEGPGFRVVSRPHDGAGHPGALRALQRANARPVGHDQAHRRRRVGPALGTEPIEQRLEVRPPARDEDGEGLRRLHPPPPSRALAARGPARPRMISAASAKSPTTGT